MDGRRRLLHQSVPLDLAAESATAPGSTRPASARLIIIGPDASRPSLPRAD